MDTFSDFTEDTKKMGQNPHINGPNLEEYREKKEGFYYEYDGYQVYVHFSGDKTLMECIKRLAERVLKG